MPSPRFVAALVRHGDYEQPERVPSAHLPHPLTTQGRAQARALAAQLATEASALELEIDATIDVSSLLRAFETGTLAAAEFGERGAGPTEVATFPELAERSTGAGANLKIEAIEAAVRADPRYADLPPAWKAHPRYRLPLPGAESLMQAGARVAAHVERRAHEAASWGDRDTLKIFVSHGGALRHAAVCLGALELQAVPGLTLRHCGYVLLEQIPNPDGGPLHWRQIGGEWKVRPLARARD